MEQKGRAPAFVRGSAHAKSRGHTFLVPPLLSFSSLSPCLGSNSSPDWACTWTLAWANLTVSPMALARALPGPHQRGS